MGIDGTKTDIKHRYWFTSIPHKYKSMGLDACQLFYDMCILACTKIAEPASVTYGCHNFLENLTDFTVHWLI